ncbi:BTAD domain-containing putative transcriptional regulator [Streptomyces sp. SS7]|uniref:AfsR/SARP family transcriptional regulator n=1 Tax=Streptomyces sp. SS7 TaxID=3108485 RepID=UPI0030EDB741
MPPEPVRFMVLGALRVHRGETELDVGGPQERAFLALLLAAAGQPVALSEIVDVLWGAEPPRSAVNVVRRHVGSLRRLLEPGLPARAEGSRLLRDAGGYRLVTDGDQADLPRFRALRETARHSTDTAPAEATELLTEALRLWHGPIGDGIPAPARSHPLFDAIERERLAAARELADAALRAGRAERALPPLRRAAADHPLDEPVHAGLLRLLAAAGHRTEARTVYETVRARLAEDLGIDPGPELTDAHAALPGEPAATGALPHVVPSQLPYDLPLFIGRETELDEVLALFDTGRPRPGTVVIGAVGGMAGVGKTTLAVHWAHRIADRFPDGQLYVNLRGFDPSGAVMEPGEAVRGFLDALGVPPERVPHTTAAQSALYRSTLAGRRVLVVLDNARDTEHVTPLLPGSPGCLTLVTSRDELPGLAAAHGARSLVLHPFDEDRTRAFLVRRLGAARVAAEPRAADEIGALCAGLPLALACVAARAAAHPHFRLADIAGELREAHGSLDAFARADASVDVGTVFSWSTDAVSPDAARLFRLLALHPGPDLTLPAATALAGLTERRTRRLLAELTGLHLVTEHSPGRHSLHDLLRAHAAELLDAHETETEREAALDRLHHHYLHTAHTADRLLAPTSDPLTPPPAPEGARPEPLADDHHALAWLTAEHAVLLAVVTAAASGRPARARLACHLAWSLEPFFDRRGHWHDALGAQRTALGTARRLADPVLLARGLRGLARIEGRLGLHTRAVPRLEQALGLFTALGDDTGRAHTHRSLGWECDQRGDLPGALRHNQHALALFRALGDRAAQASVLNSVGWYHARLGAYRAALTHCHEALHMLQDLGDRYGQATTWDSIAYAHHHLGRHPHALLGYRNALTLLRDLGVPYLEADILTRAGDTHLALGDRAAAHEAWTRALALLRELGHPDADAVETRLRCGEGRAGAC